MISELTGPVPVSFLVSEVHADEDEGGSEKEVDGDLFGENGPSEEDGGDGVEIDVVCGDNGTQFLQYPIPG